MRVGITGTEALVASRRMSLNGMGCLGDAVGVLGDVILVASLFDAACGGEGAGGVFTIGVALRGAGGAGRNLTGTPCGTAVVAFVGGGVREASRCTADDLKACLPRIAFDRSSRLSWRIVHYTLGERLGQFLSVEPGLGDCAECKALRSSARDALVPLRVPKLVETSSECGTTGGMV